jgi:hypothetical protein
MSVVTLAVGFAGFAAPKAQTPHRATVGVRPPQTAQGSGLSLGSPDGSPKIREVSASVAAPP